MTTVDHSVTQELEQHVRKDHFDQAVLQLTTAIGVVDLKITRLDERVERLEKRMDERFEKLDKRLERIESYLVNNSTEQ